MREPKIKAYDIQTMTLFEIECKIEELENALSYYLDKLEYLNSFMYPKTSKLHDILSAGGVATNNFDTYLIKKEKAEKKNYIGTAKNLENEIKLLKNYSNRQKEIIEKYDDKKQQIIYLRDKKNSWFYIANKVNYSIRQCQRIYDEYIESRKKD